MRSVIVFSMWLLVSTPVLAGGLDDLSAEEATRGVKQALVQSAETAVEKLGVANGFLDNPKVKILLPGSLQKAEGVMRTLGGAKYADGLIVAMNRAAETAAADIGPLLRDAVETLSIEDPYELLFNGDDAAIRYFSDASRETLSQAFLPIVKNATDETGLLKKYNDFAGKAAKFGLVAEKHAHIENYVTQKMLDGLYLIMAEEERAIRRDPASQANLLLRNVFGSLKQGQ